MNRKLLLTSPTTYFWLSVVLYGAFEAFNSTIVCQNVQTTISTGLFSFLGFWSLVAAVILTFKLKRETGRRHWVMFAIPVLIIVLFLFDAYLAKTCLYN